jgi:hypothetical protein
VIAGLVFLFVLAPILWPMVQEATQFRFMVRPARDLYIFSASLVDFFVPNRLHTWLRPDGWVAEWLGVHSYAWIGNQVAPPSERTVSIGYVTLALTLLATWWNRRRAGLWLLAAGFFLLLALGPRPHWGNITATNLPVTNEVVEQWTPYALLNRFIPFMRISRSVSRYALMVQLCLAVTAALGLAALLRRVRQRRVEWGLASLAGLLVLGEFWVAPYPLSPPDTPAFYAQLPADASPGAVLNLPMNYDRPGYLLYQTVHGRPLTAGYISRDDPRTLVERVPVLQQLRHLGPDILADDPAVVGLTVLHDLEVGLVILDRYKMPGGLERAYTEQIAGAIFADQPPLYEDERITVFALSPPAEPQPYLLLGALNWGSLVKVGERRSRALGAQPAQVHVRHAPPAAMLEMRYRTTPGATLSVTGIDLADVQVILPAAPEGQTVQIDLAPLTADAAGTLTLTFTASAPAAVQIESLGLVID